MREKKALLAPGWAALRDDLHVVYAGPDVVARLASHRAKMVLHLAEQAALKPKLEGLRLMHAYLQDYANEGRDGLRYLTDQLLITLRTHIKEVGFELNESGAPRLSVTLRDPNDLSQ